MASTPGARGLGGLLAWNALVQPVDHHVEAVGGEGERDGAADVLARAGDQRGTAGAGHPGLSYSAACREGLANRVRSASHSPAPVRSNNSRTVRPVV
jgi:hypothetical protein